MNDQNGQIDPRQETLNRVHVPVRMAIDIMLRGIISSAGGTVPPAVLMSMVAWHVGNLSAELLQGDMSNMLRTRKALQEAYQEGVRKARLNQGPLPNPADLVSRPHA